VILLAFAEYILMNPSEYYQPFMDVMMSKIQLSKLVIEFLTDNPDASYEDLLNHLQTAAPLKGQTASFSEDSLLRHSQWIVDQVHLLLLYHVRWWVWHCKHKHHKVDLHASLQFVQNVLLWTQKAYLPTSCQKAIPDVVFKSDRDIS